MHLICLDCANYTFFETDAEWPRSVEVDDHGLIIGDEVVGAFNYSDDAMRENLQYIITSALEGELECLFTDKDSGQVCNRYVACGKCGSLRVTPPRSTWTPSHHWLTLEEELQANRKDFEQLRKERHRESLLPVLFKQ